MNKLLILLSLVTVLSACAREKVYTVEELYQDKALAEKVKNKCDTMSFSEQMNDTNCTRLETANAQYLNESTGGKKHDPNKYK